MGTSIDEDTEHCPKCGRFLEQITDRDGNIKAKRCVRCQEKFPVAVTTQQSLTEALKSGLKGWSV